MATSLTIDRASMRQLAAAMAFVMMMASLPSIGVIIIADRSGPSISMDVCHPLQSLETSSGSVLVAQSNNFPSQTYWGTIEKSVDLTAGIRLGISF